MCDVVDDDFFRDWTTDEGGNRVRRGLSVDETAWYEEYQNKNLKHRMSDHGSPWRSVDERNKDRDRWRTLHDKHERARIAAIAAEHELRVSKPKLN